MRILIVEDDRSTRSLLLKYFESFGECDSTDNGLSAVDMVSASLRNQEPYDLISLDILMPKLDGHKTLQRIRQVENDRELPQDSRAKIIMISSKNVYDEIMESLRDECVAYLIKPINKDKISYVLGQLGISPGSKD